MSGSDMMYSSSVLLKLSGELHSLTALGRLLVWGAAHWCEEVVSESVGPATSCI